MRQISYLFSILSSIVNRIKIESINQVANQDAQIRSDQSGGCNDDSGSDSREAIISAVKTESLFGIVPHVLALALTVLVALLVALLSLLHVVVVLVVLIFVVVLVLVLVLTIMLMPVLVVLVLFVFAVVHLVVSVPFFVLVWVLHDIAAHLLVILPLEAVVAVVGVALHPGLGTALAVLVLHHPFVVIAHFHCAHHGLILVHKLGLRHILILGPSHHWVKAKSGGKFHFQFLLLIINNNSAWLF